MKVLHIITGLGAGGAEQQLRLLLRHLPVTCEVATLTNPGVVAQGIRADGTPVHHIGMRGNRDLAALPRLVRMIRAGGYDLVHTHLYRACVYGRTAARLAGVRAVVASEHSLGDGRIEGRPLTRATRALYRATERLGSATVAVSPTVAARLSDCGVPDSRIHLVPNGLDARRYRFDPAARAAARTRLGISAPDFVVGGVGRLVPGKRFDALIRAIAEVPRARLVVVGDGPERPALRRLAQGLGVTERVHLVGERGGTIAPTADPDLDIPALLSAMDVFVSPSTEECFGLAVLEALAAGLRVLHVTCPAVDDVSAAEAPGARRVFPDSPSIAAALRSCRAVGAVRLPVPAAVDRYDIARSVDRLMAVYERTAVGTAARPAAARPAPVLSVPER
jgi:glycosyltransferase involved in cell wall biosynthesis